MTCLVCSFFFREKKCHAACSLNCDDLQQEIHSQNHKVFTIYTIFELICYTSFRFYLCHIINLKDKRMISKFKITKEYITLIQDKKN